MAEFRMPSLGADMTEGVLLEWLVHPGDEVHKGDIVAVVDTSKAAVEVECFDSGVVERLLVDEGTRVPVGTPLAIIQAGVVRPESAADRHFVTSPLVRHAVDVSRIDLETVSGTGVGGRITRADIEHAVHPPAEHAAPAGHAAPAEQPRGTRLRISPLARRLATELGVDASGVIGTGPGGAVSAGDIRGAASAPPAVIRPPAAARVATTDRTAAMRATIAAAMTRSKREIPHYYLTHAIDLGGAMAWLRERNQQLPVSGRLVPAVLLFKAAALAARTVPQINGFWIDNTYVPSPAVHPGVAISLRGGGLVAPAIHDAADLDLSTLMAKTRDLVTRTRAGRLRGSELADPTITVSNLGDQGVESIMGVIYPPQVALVGFGTILERPWALGGLIGVRPVVVASLSGDHRATDGATGARYLRTIEQLLRRPEEL